MRLVSILAFACLFSVKTFASTVSFWAYMCGATDGSIGNNGKYIFYNYEARIVGSGRAAETKAKNLGLQSSLRACKQRSQHPEKCIGQCVRFRDTVPVPNPGRGGRGNGGGGGGGAIGGGGGGAGGGGGGAAGNDDGGAGNSVSLCPDGHYHKGGCSLCPDGQYHGGSCNLCPDGQYHGGSCSLCPDGKYHANGCSLCPDGEYHDGGTCVLGPDGKYH